MKLTREQLDEFEQRHRASVADLPGLQARVLQLILERAQKSAFLRDHGVSGTAVDDYRARVPIRSYREHTPYVTRMMNGEHDVLFDGLTRAFLTTAGTTSTPKVVPDRELSEQQRALSRIDDEYEIALFLREHPGLSFYGRHLADDPGLWLPLVAAPPHRDEQGRLIAPHISGLVYEQVYRSAPELYFTRPSWLPHMAGAVKLYVLARLAVDADIRLVNGPLHGVAELARVVNTSTADLLRDVRDGTISRDIPPALAAELPPLRPDPERARGLEALAARDGGLWPRHLWPRLAVVRTFCQGGMAVHSDFLRAAYGAQLRDLGLWSTEGRGLAYCVQGTTPLVIAAHRNFYELVDDDDRVHLLHEVERGKTYRIVVTSPYGLYRYDTRDLVEVVGQLHGVPTIEIRGRAGAINIAGEKMTESHVAEAMTAVLGADRERVAGFAFVPHLPSEGRRGLYELAIEYAPPLPSAAQLAAAVESEICRVNTQYLECCFTTPAMDRLRVTFVPSGWFAAFRGRMLEERGMQAKPPLIWTGPRPDEWPPLARES